MNIDELRDLLERYRQGTASAREKKAVEDWYAALHPGDEAPLSDDAVEASLARVRERLSWADERDARMPWADGRVIGGGPGADGQGSGRNIVRVVWPAAAALAVLAVGIWLLRLPHRNAGPVVAGGSEVAVVTNKGETRQIVLPDGSTLELNAGTELHYATGFTGKERLITLTRGEAYFQVVADAARPFVVMAGGLRTCVLGTSFDIRAYPEEGRIRIAVLSGKVKVNSRILEKGMLMRADTGGLITERFETEEEVAAWKRGGLYFKDASFDQIAFEVANKYNIPLINRSHKRIWSYTGTFRSESLQEVIETICQTENLGYTFSNGQLLITDH
jgi:transmembrane sensor